MNGNKFLKEKLELIFVILMAINVIWGALVFLGFLGLDLIGWLILNVCSPSEIVAIIGLLSKKKTISNISVPMLLMFGGGGLFLFSWSGYMIQAQLNHILMVLVSIYILWTSYKVKAFKKMLAGIVIGGIVVALIEFLIFPVYFTNAPPKVIEILKDMGFLI